MTGIRRGRKLGSACRRDLAFIYLSKCYRLGKIILNDFRKNHYAHFESLFLQILNKCEEAGIVNSAISIIDGSKIDAYNTAYNVQIACTENQIITYAHVTTQGNDKAQLIPAIKGIKSNTDTIVDTVLADADYGNYDSFEYMKEENIEGYVPYRDMNVAFADNPYHSTHFVYNADTDEYTCPQNEILIFKKEVKKKERLI